MTYRELWHAITAGRLATQEPLVIGGICHAPGYDHLTTGPGGTGRLRILFPGAAQVLSQNWHTAFKTGRAERTVWNTMVLNDGQEIRWMDPTLAHARDTS